MMKALSMRSAGLFVLLCFSPCLAYCCFLYESCTAMPSGNCTVNLAWTFEECGEAGTYYIEYSPDGVNFSIIGSITGLASPSAQSYTFTDNDAHPPGSGSASPEYKIVFVIQNTGTTYPSATKTVNLGATSCSLTTASRCSGLSGITMSGPATLCPPADGTYSISNSMPTIWSVALSSGITSGISSSTSTFGGSITVDNSSATGGYATVSTNYLGCLSLSTVVQVGVPPNFGYTISPAQNPFCTNDLGNNAMIEGTLPNPNVSFEWGYVDESGTNGSAVVNSNGGITQNYMFSNPSSDMQLYARAENTCGFYLGNTVTLDLQVSDNCNGGTGGLTAKKDSVKADKNAISAGPASGSNVLVLYPNPVAGSVAVQLPDSVNLGGTFIRVTDQSGRSLKLIVVTAYTTTIDMSAWAAGIYYVEIVQPNSRVVRKVVKTVAR